MKKLIIPTLGLALVLGLAPLASAETGSTSTSTWKQEVDSRNSAVKAAMQKFRDEVKKAKGAVKNEVQGIQSEFKIEIAQRNAARTVTVFNATIDRLNKIIDRINTRIAKVKAAGGNTSKAESAVAAAKAEIVVAQTDIAAISSLDLTSTSTAPQEFKAVKTGAAKVKADLKIVRKDLEQAVSALNMSAKGLKNATSTESTAGENR